MVTLGMPIGTMEWIIIFVIVLLLFGSTKIPQLMKGLGEGVKEFKKGLKDEPEQKAASGPNPSATHGEGKA